jgi:hypothetical protein
MDKYPGNFGLPGGIGDVELEEVKVFFMSNSAYIILPVIFLVTSFITYLLRLQIPEPHRLIYDAGIALTSLMTALFEHAIIKKSVYTVLLFLILPFVFVAVSSALWLFDIPYSNLDLWVSFVYWDSVILFSLLVWFYLLRKKIVK